MFCEALKKKSLIMMAVLVLIVSLSGCVYVVVGGLGAVGGYVVSPDTVEGVIAGRDFSEIWESAIEVVSIMGIIEERDDDTGILITKIRGARVTISITQMNRSTIRLNVKARKYFFPKIKTAQDIYVKIINYMEG